MKIEIVVDPSKPPPLSARVGPAPATTAKPAARLVLHLLDKSGISKRLDTFSTRGRRPGRGKGPRKAERPAKTAADLDAEMEVSHCALPERIKVANTSTQDYTASNAPAAAA